MNHILFCDIFSNEDIRKVEKHFREWISTNEMKGILLFDVSIMNQLYKRAVEQKVHTFLDTNGSSRKFGLGDLRIVWYELSGTKAILKTVNSISTGKVLYSEPSSWNEATVWYQFK